LAEHNDEDYVIVVFVLKTTHPIPLIENFFQTRHLGECRNLLREVLHQALSGYSHRESINPQIC
jgi:hypothetical protein